MKIIIQDNNELLSLHDFKKVYTSCMKSDKDIIYLIQGLYNDGSSIDLYSTHSIDDANEFIYNIYNNDWVKIPNNYDLFELLDSIFKRSHNE